MGLGMGRYFKILVVAALVVAHVQGIEILRDEGDNVVVDMNWATILSRSNTNQDISIVCDRCEGMCPSPGYTYGFTHNEPPTPEMIEDFHEIHRACAVGCKSSCLYQIGPKRYNYRISKSLCMQACQTEFKVENPMNEKYLEHCNQGCSIRIAALIPKSYAIELDEAESMLIDPGLDHDSRDGTIPRSSYRTIPHKDAMEKHTPTPHRPNLLDKSTLDLVLNFFKNHKADPILAGAVAIPLLLSLFGLMGYLLYLVSVTNRSRNVNQHYCSNEDGDDQQLLLHVELGSDEKKALLSQSDLDMDDDFVPPQSPPPKYSDIVQTV